MEVVCSQVSMGLCSPWLPLCSSIAMCCTHVPISPVNQSLCRAASLAAVTVYPLITNAHPAHLSTRGGKKLQRDRTKWTHAKWVRGGNRGTVLGAHPRTVWARPEPQRQHKQGRLLLRVTAAETGDETFHYQFP